MRIPLIACIVFATIAIPSTIRAEVPDKDVAFEKSLDLLDAQMKLRVIHRLLELGFYIPRSTIEQYQDEERQLLADLRLADQKDALVSERWAADQKKIGKLEDIELQKLAEKWGKAILKNTTAAAQNLREFDRQVNAGNSAAKLRAIDRARYVEAILSAKVNSSGAGAQREAAQSIRELYRGSITDTNKLVVSLVELKKQRNLIDGSLAVMRDVQKAMERIDLIYAAAKPGDTAIEMLGKEIKSRTDAAIISYLKTVDEDLDPEVVKKLTGDLKKIGGSAYSAWCELDSLDKDASLNPTVRATAKRFAVFGAMYNCTLGLVKEYAPNCAGPVLDIFDFYAQAVGLVPTIARKMSAVVAKMDQGLEGPRALSEFDKVPSTTKLFSITPMGRKYSLSIGYDQGDNELAAQKLFFVSPEVNPRGWATISQSQYQRMVRIASDERLANAFSEALHAAPIFTASAIEDTVTHPEVAPMSAWSPLDPNARESYVKALKEKAVATPYSPKQLVEMAQSNDDAAELMQTKRETEIDVLAREMAVREALASFKESDLKDWDAYIELLRTARVPMAPSQILNLFNFYVKSPNRDKLVELLKRKSEERLQHRLGVPRIGIPDISFSPSDTIKPNSSVEVKATLIISDLAPERRVPAQATFTFPSFANPKAATGQFQLTNGITTVQARFSVPRDFKGSAHPVKLEIKTLESPPTTRPVIASRTVTLGSEPKILAWVLKGQPLINPGRKPSADNDGGTEQPATSLEAAAVKEGRKVLNVWSRKATVARSEINFVYTCVSTNTKPGLVKNTTEQAELSWDAPLSVFRASEKLSFNFNFKGKVQQTGRPERQIYEVPLHGFAIGIASDYREGQDVQRIQSATAIETNYTVRWPKTYALTAPSGKPGQIIGVYVRCNDNWPGNNRVRPFDGAVVVWVYELKELTQQEYLNAVQAARARKPTAAAPPPLPNVQTPASGKK